MNGLGWKMGWMFPPQLMKTGDILYNQLKEQREKDKEERPAKRRRVRPNKLRFEQLWNEEFRGDTPGDSSTK